MVRMSKWEYNQLSAIQLSPFIHQVGGHSSMFQYDQNTVCKLLATPELDFYQSLPEALKPSLRNFEVGTVVLRMNFSSLSLDHQGIITVQYCEDELGFIKLIAQPPATRTENDSSSSTVYEQEASASNDSENILRQSVQLRCFQDGHVDYSNSSGMDMVNYEQGKTTISKINPWSLQLCKKQAEKLHRQLIGDENGPVSQKYILLENVTARFHHPCILDLKMGKRQYTDIDSDKKRQSKIQKCELSTSSKLGVRLCGMQVYQIANGRYVFTDKYRGRILNIEEFRLSLVQYLDNGHQKRLDVVPEIIKRLESLYDIISSLLKYRFYSGSLLIVYDGSPQSNLIDVRMIDFANTIRNNPTDDSPPIHTGPDKGYLYGLECLIGFFKEILNDSETKQQ